MKLIFLFILTMILAGCGDTTNTTVVVPATKTTPLTFNNFTGHPPVLAGAAAFIPSNTFCTAKMNEVFNSEGSPLNIAVIDGPATFHREWLYQTPEVTSKYYFTWSDSKLTAGERCYFDFYKSYTIIP